MYDTILPKYIKNINNDTADIFLFDFIGEGAISGQGFADEIKMLNDFGIKQINVHINSGGGSVMDGFSIFSAMTNSEATIHTINEGVAGSIAGVFLLAGDKISMFDFSRVLIHNVSGSENPDENEQNSINALQDSLVTILTNRTNKSKQEIIDMMDKETWLNAKEALKAGFIDEIISSKKTSTAKKTNRQSLAHIVNTLTPKTEKMKTIAKYLGLSEDASEQSVLDAIKEIENKAKQVKTDLDTKEAALIKAEETIVNQKASIKSFEDKQNELNEAIVVETVDTAIKEGKFEEKDKEALVAQFKGNHEGLKLIVNSFKSPAMKITGKLKSGETSSSASIPENRKDWGFGKWEKEDQKGLDSIKNTNIEAYKVLYKTHYNVDFVEA